jgi:hypothetical protein
MTHPDRPALNDGSPKDDGPDGDANDEAPIDPSHLSSGGLLGDDEGGMPDLVDTMHQMQTSGRIDTSAFRGERNDDDVAMLGEEGIEDGDIVDE